MGMFEGARELGLHSFRNIPDERFKAPHSICKAEQSEDLC